MFYTRKEVTDKLGCDRNHIYYLIRKKRLTRYKRLGRIYFLKEEVDNLAAFRSDNNDIITQSKESQGAK